MSRHMSLKVRPYQSPRAYIGIDPGPPASDTYSALDKEIERLRAENASLRAENAELRHDIATTQPPTAVWSNAADD